MNVKLKLLSTGVLFFLGSASLLAQENGRRKKDTADVKDIEEVVVVGLKSTTKKQAVISTAKIESEKINNRPNSNLMNIAQGQLAGVNISTGSGQPGAKPTVVIRGFSTINGNTDPLYVIDGFPTNADSFRSLNPNDVESMEVLKDASATAMYGNRGANGVIVIRTKGGGFASKTVFNYRSQIGVSTLQNNRYNMADAKQLLTLEKMASAGKGVGMTYDEIANFNVNTNWLDYFFNPSLLQSHDFGITTGGQNLSSYTNVGYLEQQGVLSTTGLKRFSLRTNVNGKTNNNKFTYRVGVYAGLSRNTQASSLGTGGVNQNLVIGGLRGAPYISPNDYVSGGGISANLVNTPLFLMDKERTYKSATDDLRLDLTSEANYKITDELTATMRANAQLLSLDGNSYQTPDAWNSVYFKASNQTWIGWETMSTSRQFNFNNLYQLSYSKRIGDHKIDVLGGYEYNNYMIKTTSFTQNGLNPKVWVPGTGTGYPAFVAGDNYNVPNVSAGQSRLNMYSYFANLDYDYKSKYGVVANVRRDATSRFSKDNRWGTFWSVGARWNINEENFMKNIEWVNILKIRGSYGTAGNQRIVDGTIFAGLNPKAYLNSYVTGSNSYNGTQALGISLGYPDLHWETTKQWNAGVDFELFKRRLRGTFDVYEKKGVEIFYPWPQSYLIGTGAVNMNSPIDLKNNGIEINFAYDVIKNSNLTLTLRGNGAMNKERVYNLPSEPLIDGTIPMQYSVNGQLYQAPYVYHYLGVNQSNGNLLFEDANGNPTETPTTADLKPLKYGFNPKFQGGFGFDLDYKGWFVNTTFTYVAKVYRYDYDWASVMDPSNLGSFNVSADLLNAWTPTNTNTNIPSLKAQNINYDGLSDRFLVDGSYLRLRNVQVGYNVPKSLIKNTFVNSLSITLQAENLVTWSKWKGFDAESNIGSDQGRYPSPRIYTLGFDIKF
ncbi:SusC/RagA family TonB-linked outer membrane protein [Chryseobacterium geocarposphaerae]|uniref:TonB-linked SusC/RagA family outer membrane protein n=1 Tax=Chryseobacterium geocarposphaerae TaxID=1416776 RepID=A0A2M9C1C7_9FLAO|nr:SusC/RagA family TonB-linked outer membrane protein [Chryseobacterium geocarposphaerae]PJJ64226.1 TonB-linked SusC/RagA family outer membrane protein [Chryseobacterium geocarposphaerae]